MADERDDNISDDQDGSPTTGQQSQDNEFGARGQQAAGGGSQSTTSGQGDGMSGQPIGGNDSATGTGTTLTQGADFSDRSDDGDFGQGTTSNAGGSSVGIDQTSGGSSGVSGGEGFVGSQGDNSGDYLQQGGSGSDSASGEGATGGSDFAKQGRGALDEDDEESDGSGGSF